MPEMLDHSGMTVKPFKGLFVCQPTLSLSDDDDLVYFMTKAKSMDGKAWVIAVDMKNNTLQGVDEFVAERTIGVDFGYMHSRISKYLTAAPGNHVRAMQPSSHGYFYKSFGSVVALSQYYRKSPAKLVQSIYSLMSGSWVSKCHVHSRPQIQTRSIVCNRCDCVVPVRQRPVLHQSHLF